MKTKITLIGLALSSLFTHAQNVADFESFTLSPNSAYSPTVSTPFQTSNAIFDYAWDPSFGGFWSDGFAYTNKQDSTTGSFTNLYGVKALKGYNGSAKYVVGMEYGIIKLKSPNVQMDGFYITNTTYAYETIKKGDSFSRKFGDTTGTGSGTTIPQGSYPDYFKITAKGFKNGTMKPDSAVFFLADYRFSNNSQDYVVKTWEWFNTTSLGAVDSVIFFMYSSDNGSFGMNTPGFFAMDNFSTSPPNPVGLKDAEQLSGLQVYPNPFNSNLVIIGNSALNSRVILRDVTGKIILQTELLEEKSELNTSALEAGVYFLDVNSGNERSIKKLVKNQ